MSHTLSLQRTRALETLTPLDLKVTPSHTWDNGIHTQIWSHPCKHTHTHSLVLMSFIVFTMKCRATVTRVHFFTFPSPVTLGGCQDQEELPLPLCLYVRVWSWPLVVWMLHQFVGRKSVTIVTFTLNYNPHPLVSGPWHTKANILGPACLHRKEPGSIQLTSIWMSCT